MALLSLEKSHLKIYIKFKDIHYFVFLKIKLQPLYRAPDFQTRFEFDPYNIKFLTENLDICKNSLHFIKI
jgi:hypothetical protein